MLLSYRPELSEAFLLIFIDNCEIVDSLSFSLRRCMVTKQTVSNLKLNHLHRLGRMRACV